MGEAATGFQRLAFFCASPHELLLVGREQDELGRQLEDSVSDEERKELHREQERLLLKMERKGEQIHKLHKHRKQVGAPANKHVSLTSQLILNSEFFFNFLSTRASPS